MVFYNRANEAAAQLEPGDFDWDSIFAGGAAAKASGAVVSFDPNYRKKLWDVWGGRERAVPIVRRIVENVDVLVGNEEDLQQALGIPGPEVATESKLDPSAFFGMIDLVVAKYPQIKVVATTLREVLSSNRHRWGAVAWVNGETYASPTCDLAVFDRVGGRRRLRVRFLLRPPVRSTSVATPQLAQRPRSGSRRSWTASRMSSA